MIHREARRDAYDVVVVGGGFGGLSAGAILARAGRRVLLVEQHDRVGGCGQAFHRHGTHFDAGVRLLSGCGPGGVLAQMLEALGIYHRIPLIRIDPLCGARYPAHTLDLPTGVDSFIAACAAAFPAEARGFQSFIRECVRLRDEADATAFDPQGYADETRFPTLMRHRRSTLAQVLDAHLSDPGAKALLATLWPYVGLPPGQASFVYFAIMLLCYLMDGAHYCRGTFQTLADVLAASVVEQGGEVLLGVGVRRIETEGGRVSGVVLEHGQRVTAPIVISNADLKQTALELVGQEQFPSRWIDRLQRLVPSHSCFSVYGVTTLDLRQTALPHETFLYASLDHEESFRRSVGNDPDWLTLSIPTRADPELASPGHHAFIITTLIGYGTSERWRHDKAPLAAQLLHRAETLVPGLRASLVSCDSGTPATIERYTRNSTGAMYGFALSPTQVANGRPAAKTPLEGLLLAGHWTRPGGGVYAVLTSGIEAARLALGHPSVTHLWRDLG